MSEDKVIIERRKHKRFKSCSGIFAIKSNFGIILNISMGGLAFRYVEKGKWPGMPIETGALFGEDDLWIDKIPLAWISDCVANEGVSGKSAVVKKRCVKFGKLNPKQIELVEKFIGVNTIGAVEETQTV